MVQLILRTSAMRTSKQCFQNSGGIGRIHSKFGQSTKLGGQNIAAKFLSQKVMTVSTNESLLCQQQLKKIENGTLFLLFPLLYRIAVS